MYVLCYQIAESNFFPSRFTFFAILFLWILILLGANRFKKVFKEFCYLIVLIFSEIQINILLYCFSFSQGVQVLQDRYIYIDIYMYGHFFRLPPASVHISQILPMFVEKTETYTFFLPCRIFKWVAENVRDRADVNSLPIYLLELQQVKHNMWFGLTVRSYPSSANFFPINK